MIYGVDDGKVPCNLKTLTEPSKKLPYSSPITLEYDRQAQTVKFTSDEFAYYQTGLPEDVVFSVGVWLNRKPQVMTVTFIYIK